MPTTGGGVSSGGAGALTLISTSTLSGAGTFDVSAIAGTYNDLILVLIGRSAVGGTRGGTNVIFNADGGANYYQEKVVANVATATASEALGAVSISGIDSAGSTAPAGSFSVMRMTVYGYAATTWIKPLVWEAHAMTDTASGGAWWNRGSGAWNSTAAITRVQINAAGTNFLTSSQLRIYGRL